MKKKKKQAELEDDEQHHLEIIKAVAQAWHGHSANSAPTKTSEFDAHRLNFKGKPSRFKVEAARRSSAKDNNGGGAGWDFGRSLWDSFEIMSVSKRLESGLVLDHQFSALDEQIRKRRKESKNSLRNLLNRVSPRRFHEDEEKDSQF